MRRWIGFGLLLVVMSGLALLDLSQQGLLWRWIYSQTGEETVPAQIRGLIELPGTWIRTPLRTDTYTPIHHTSDNPFGINTFLEQEADVAVRDRTVQTIAEAGFGWIRQEFPWQDIEIHARGDFMDRRNEAAIGIVDAWAKYDHIVDVIESYGLRLQVRLSNPPAWTHANPEIGEKAPPDSLQDFVNFAVAVAERYRGRIHHYQIWNEPNIYPEWGNQPVNPEAYTEMLCRTYEALKAVDPEIVVIAAALAPTINLTDNNLSDLVFLQRMYDAGAGDCFDVMSTQGYGFFSGPSDQRMRPTTLTFSHHLYIRDIMVANGDSHKPIWLAEAAWNAQPEDPSVVTIQYGNFGIATPEEAARYITEAYDRAADEWPWLGVINYWFFKRADESDRNQAYYYFRMVEPNFSPLPVYDALRRYIREGPHRLSVGTHQAEAWAVDVSQDARLIEAAGAQEEHALTTHMLSWTTCATDVRLRWRGTQSLQVSINGSIVQPLAPRADGGWQLSSLTESLLRQCQTFQVSAASDASAPEIDSIQIIDQTPGRAGLGAALGLSLGAGVVYLLIDSLRKRSKR